MDKTFVYCTAIWAGVIVFVVSAITLGCVVAGNNDHNFDVTCIENGKTIQYETLNGDDYERKVCK